VKTSLVAEVRPSIPVLRTAIVVFSKVLDQNAGKIAHGDRCTRIQEGRSLKRAKVRLRMI
jgi:hypothetical protein